MSALIRLVSAAPGAQQRLARQLRELGYTVSESPSDDLDLIVADKNGGGDNGAGTHVFTAGKIAVDTLSHRVTVNDTQVNFARREFDLLLFLMRHPDRVFNRRQLLADIWGRQLAIGPRTVDVHVRRVRRLLEPHGCDGYIQTIRRIGYRFSLRV